MAETEQEQDLILDARERDVVQSAFVTVFGRTPELAEGIRLRLWRSGELRGQPRLSPGLRTMLEKGLVTVRIVNIVAAQADFTPAGLEAIRRTVKSRPRWLNRTQFAQVLAELAGKDPLSRRQTDHGLPD